MRPSTVVRAGNTKGKGVKLTVEPKQTLEVAGGEGEALAPSNGGLEPKEQVKMAKVDG